MPTTGDVQIDAIINIGAKVFTLIKEENAPLITTASVAANALRGWYLVLECSLKVRQYPRAEVYRVTKTKSCRDFEACLVYIASAVKSTALTQLRTGA